MNDLLRLFKHANNIEVLYRVSSVGEVWDNCSDQQIRSIAAKKKAVQFYEDDYLI